MKLTQLSMKPLANNLAITHDDRPNKRIRTDLPPPTLRKLKSPPQVRAIGSCKRGSHVD